MTPNNPGMTCQISLLIALLISSNSLKAGPITFQFEGEFFNYGNESAFSSNFTSGDPVFGRFTFDSSTPDSNSDPEAGIYRDAIRAAHLRIGEFSFALDPLQQSIIGITRKYFEAFDSYYSLYSVGFKLKPALGVTDLSFLLHYEQFDRPRDFPSPLVRDDSLSSTPPDTTTIDPSSFFHLYVADTERYTISALSSTKQALPALTRVSEPNTSILLTLGLLAAFGPRIFRGREKLS